MFKPPIRNFFCILIAFYTAFVNAQTIELVEVSTARPNVTERAVLVKSDKPLDTALIFFKGTDAPVNIRKVEDFRWLSNFFIDSPPLFNEAKVALVIMGCPSDQLSFGDCMDPYRKSQGHANDVLLLMDYLKQSYGVKNFYVMGHSSGTISSKWLAVNLGDKLSGSINASTMFKSYMGWATSSIGIDMESVKIPLLYVHHRNDECPSSPYSGARHEATKDNLVTVVGGGVTGNRCYTHHHGFEDRGNEVASAVLRWIKTKEVEKTVGQE